MGNSKKFDVFYHFCKEMDNNGSITWTLSESEVEVTYYYNNWNSNLNEILYKLNKITKKVGIRECGWKRTFIMRISNPSYWINDFLGQVKFYVKEWTKIYNKFVPNCLILVFFQDFVNVSIKCLCYCSDESKGNCCIHIFQKMLNEILCYGRDEKKVEKF